MPRLVAAPSTPWRRVSFERSGQLTAASSTLRLSSSGDRHGRRLYGCRIDPTTEANRDAVPSVDDVDHQCELDLLRFRELSLQGFVGAHMRMPFGEPRQSLGPAE